MSIPNRFLIVVAIAAWMCQWGCRQQELPQPAAPSESSPAADSDTLEDASDDESASIFPTLDLAPPAGYEFETPVRIKAGDDFVSVEAPGYACPTFADVDGDGQSDLVVGQFKNGHMQFCRNVADQNEPPRFATAQWLMSGDKRAEVPGVW